jgi:hypothetical protein
MLMNLVICIPTNDLHYLKTSISHIAIWNIGSLEAEHYPISLADSNNVSLPKIQGDCLVYNKRLFDRFFSNSSFDLETFFWIRTNKSIDKLLDLSLFDRFKKFYRDITDYISYIPNLLLKGHCEDIYSLYEDIGGSINSVDEFYKNIVFPCIVEIERNGLKVDLDILNKKFNKDYKSDIVPTFYHLHNVTGRPSNAFDNINFSALNKSDDTRNSFITRFDNGRLVEFDFDGYHIRLIASLIGYDLPKNIKVHNYFGKMYFKKEVLSDKEYLDSKSLTFKLLYSEYRDNNSSIPFMDKVYNYIDSIWETFNNTGFIESPVSKRIMRRENFGEMTKSKLFNYFIQMIETEFSMLFIYKVLGILKSKKSKIVLYTYDSILIDFNEEDGYETIEQIRSNIILSKVKIGKNYKDMHSYPIEEKH